jgi:hypothetical protein
MCEHATDDQLAVACRQIVSRNRQRETLSDTAPDSVPQLENAIAENTVRYSKALGHPISSGDFQGFVFSVVFQSRTRDSAAKSRRYSSRQARRRSFCGGRLIRVYRHVPAEQAQLRRGLPGPTCSTVQARLYWATRQGKEPTGIIEKPNSFVYALPDFVIPFRSSFR